MNLSEKTIAVLCCPRSGQPLRLEHGVLVAADGLHRYRIEDGIPLFAEEFCSAEARTQQQHYDVIAESYTASLDYAHTQEYTAYLDAALTDAIGHRLGLTAELCCGRGEAIRLLGNRMDGAVGVDISVRMLSSAMHELSRPGIALVQGDATHLPLATDAFDSVVMLGGIHHVADRLALFQEVRRILKPGGWFYFREPVSDFFLWRWIRSVIYRLSPQLDHATERPLLHEETVPVLVQAGLKPEIWRTVGLFGFCLFMNSDVLLFNRPFRHVPGIRKLVRGSAWLDDRLTRLPAFARAGLIVVGAARKPA